MAIETAAIVRSSEVLTGCETKTTRKPVTLYWLLLSSKKKFYGRRDKVLLKLPGATGFLLLRVGSF